MPGRVQPVQPGQPSLLMVLIARCDRRSTGHRPGPNDKFAATARKRRSHRSQLSVGISIERGTSMRLSRRALAVFAIFLLAACSTPPSPPTATPAPAPTHTPQPTLTDTPLPTQTATVTASATRTDTATPEPTNTLVPTATAQPAASTALLQPAADGGWIITDHEAGFSFEMTSNWHLEDVADLELLDTIEVALGLKDKLGLSGTSQHLIEPDGMRVLGIYLDDDIPV